MKTHILLPPILFCFCAAVYGQTPLQKDRDISVLLGIASTVVYNDNIRNDKNLIIDDKFGADFSIEYSRYFWDRIGVGVGLGFSNYEQVYYQKGLFRQMNQVDKNGDVYEKWIDSDLKYTNKLMYANVPVKLHVLLGGSSWCYAYLDAGLINQFLLKGTYAENGSIETMGKYPSETGHPDWFGLTTDNEFYDHKTVSVSRVNNQKYTFYNLSAHLSVGVAAMMTKDLYFKVQPFINAGITDISNSDDKDKMYENVVGGKSSYKGTRLYSCGISLGCAYEF